MERPNRPTTTPGGLPVQVQAILRDTAFENEILRDSAGKYLQYGREGLLRRRRETDQKSVHQVTLGIKRSAYGRSGWQQRMDYAVILRVRFREGTVAGSDIPGRFWDSIGLGRRRGGLETLGFLLKFSLRLEQR